MRNNRKTKISGPTNFKRKTFFKPLCYKLREQHDKFYNQFRISIKSFDDPF